jgi:hypothetical protein
MAIPDKVFLLKIDFKLWKADVLSKIELNFGVNWVFVDQKISVTS